MKQNLKFILTFLFAGCTLSNLVAQDYYDAWGGQLLISRFETSYSNTYEEVTSYESPFVPAIVYKATLAFSDAFAISSYPSLGLFYDSRVGGAFGIHVPALAEIYLGDFEDSHFHFGAGFSYGFITGASYAKGTVMGPIGAMGGQFYFRDNLIGIQASYTLGINKETFDAGTTVRTDKKSMFTFGIYYPIGR